MILESIENCLSLFVSILGLLMCLFRYIRTPKRGYLFLIAFFLSSFSSEYYWTTFTLVMHTNPNVSELLAYLGWNLGFTFLFAAVYVMRKEDAKGYFHPLILLPIVTNIAQFLLYIQFGGLINNAWQVTATTASMVLCLRELIYYWKHRDNGAQFPHLAALVLLYLMLEYGSWTASCFDWEDSLLHPYYLFAFLSIPVVLSFVWAVGKDYAAEASEEADTGWEELSFQTIVQAIASIVIFGACAAGYYIAVRIKNSAGALNAGSDASQRIMTALVAITGILILIVLLLLFEINRHYREAREKEEQMDQGVRSRVNFIFTLSITLALMVFAVIYNSRVIYKASVNAVYEDGKNVVMATSTDLENYLTVAETTLRVVSDTIDMMEREDASSADILRYLTDQTRRQAEQFDENFTGIYAYAGGIYMDGSGWVPPEDYNPVERDWYKTAVNADGEVVIVSPYVDAQTGSVVITFARCIPGRNHGDDTGASDVVGLDVIVNHIQEVTEKVNIASKGSGIVINEAGFIVAEKEKANVGRNIRDLYGEEIMERIAAKEASPFHAVLNEVPCMVFVEPVLDQWYTMIVVSDMEVYDDVHSQLAVNILVSLVTFWLISFFYYFGYKNEQNYGRKLEEMNVQVVGALAEAIDAKDTYTNGHSSRVAKYAKMIAARAGLSEAAQNEIYMMGLLHDVGKIGIPDEVINKPSKLTEEEFELIRQHPVIGSRILASIKERPKLSTGARWHHERFGGGGYPDNIKGEEIPPEARIIAVADAYDAMTSRRSYRDIMPQEKVREEIEAGSGTQFDPKYAKIMLKLIDEDKDYSMREK